MSGELWIFSFVWLRYSWVLWQCASWCLNRTDNTERNKSNWSSITSACHITLVLHSGSAYAPHGWCAPRAKDLFSVIRPAPSIHCCVSWPIVQGVMKPSWTHTRLLASTIWLISVGWCVPLVSILTQWGSYTRNRNTEDTDSVLCLSWECGSK